MNSCETDVKMSFLEALQKKKTGLKITNTTVKTASGEVFLEKRNESGVVSLEKVSSDVGYVVDLKPDLQVAEVIPGLYMGSQDVTQDENLLHKSKITNILSVGIRVPEVKGVKYSFIEALDLPEFDMKRVFEESTNLIDSVRNTGGSIFVHCNAGVSRSASVVIAYLMKSERLKYQQAYDVIKNARPCIKPNNGFVQQLLCLEKELFS